MSHRATRFGVALVIGLAIPAASVTQASAQSVYTGYFACARAGDAGMASGAWSSYECEQVPSGPWGGKPSDRFFLVTTP